MSGGPLLTNHVRRPRLLHGEIDSLLLALGHVDIERLAALVDEPAREKFVRDYARGRHKLSVLQDQSWRNAHGNADLL